MPASCRLRTIVLNSRITSAGCVDRGVARLGGEERQRVVAPVVDQPAFEQDAVVGVHVNRQQLDGRDAELAQIANRRLGRQAGVRAAELLGNFFVELREAFDVHFVDERLMRRRFRRAVVAPGERFVDDAASGASAALSSLLNDRSCLLVAEDVARQRVGPIRHAGDRLGVRIEQHLVGVEAMAFVRLVRSVDAVAVELPGPDVGQVDVPDHVGVLGQIDALGLFLVVRPSRTGTARPSWRSRCRDAKLTPRPSQVAPSGYGRPGQIRIEVSP